MPSRFDGPLQAALSAEAAESLVHTARRLREALDALRKHDAEVQAEARLPNVALRGRLVDTAAERFLGYIVQREAIGLNDGSTCARPTICRQKSGRDSVRRVGAKGVSPGSLKKWTG